MTTRPGYAPAFTGPLHRSIWQRKPYWGAALAAALPVLAIGGAESSGEGPGNTMRLTADDVQTLVIPGCAHWVAEQAPDQLLAVLTTFLAPYWDGMAAG